MPFDASRRQELAVDTKEQKRHKAGIGPPTQSDMFPLLWLPRDQLTEVLAHLGVLYFPKMASSTVYFMHENESIMQDAIVKLANKLKQDTKELVRSVARAMDCIAVGDNQTLCEQLNWLMEKSNQFAEVKLNPMNTLSSVACLPDMESAVFRLLLRVVTLFADESANVARRGLCMMCISGRGRMVNAAEWLLLKRGMWGGDEGTRVDAVRLVLCVLGDNGFCTDGLLMGEESASWVMNMLNGDTLEKRWGMTLTWLLADSSKKQGAVLVKAGVVTAIGDILDKGVSDAVLPAMFLQGLNILNAVAKKDNEAFCVMINAICSEVESERPVLLETDLCAWMARLVWNKSVALPSPMGQRVIDLFFNRLKEEHMVMPPFTLASIIAGIGKFGAHPSFTANIVCRLVRMLVESQSPKLQLRACGSLSAIARDTSCDQLTACPTYENAFRFVPHQDIDAAVPALIHIMKTGQSSDIAHAVDALGCIAQSSTHAIRIGDYADTLKTLVSLLHAGETSIQQSVLMALSNLGTVPRHAQRMATLGALEPAITILSCPLHKKGAEFATSLVAILAMCPICVKLLLDADVLDHLNTAVANVLERNDNIDSQFTLAWSLVAVCAVTGAADSAQCEFLAWRILSRFTLAWFRFSPRKKKSTGIQVLVAFRETLERRLNAAGDLAASHPFTNNHTMHMLRLFLTHGESRTTRALREFCLIARFDPPGIANYHPY